MAEINRPAAGAHPGASAGLDGFKGVPVAKVKKVRRKGGRGGVGEADLEPLVQRTLTFLENSPKGASRQDILTAMNLQSSSWAALRGALEHSGDVLVVGRGPGLRHVHRNRAEPTEGVAAIPQGGGNRATWLQARHALEIVLQQKGSIDSADAQAITGLKADPVRRLLLEMVDDKKVDRTGTKRSTRYHWIK
jgi:hypothetical protein